MIGAGRDPELDRPRACCRNLQRAGFAGPGVAGEPERPRTWPASGPCASILDIAEEVDLAIVVVPGGGGGAVVEECGRKQVYGVVILSAGFAEAGAEGAALEAEVLRVGPLVGHPRGRARTASASSTPTPTVRLHATFADVAAPPGPAVAAVGVRHGRRRHRRASAREPGSGISSFVALGNRADVSGNDLLQYWEADDTHRRRRACTSRASATRGTSAAWPAGSRGPSRWSR